MGAAGAFAGAPIRVSTADVRGGNFTIRLPDLFIRMNPESSSIRNAGGPSEAVPGSASKPPDSGAAAPATRERRTQAMRSSETQRRLCQAAVELLTEVGYANVTTAQIAERAGVSKGAQAHHYPSKDDMVVAAIRHLLREWEAERPAYASAAVGSQALEQLQHALWKNIFGRPDYLAALEVVLLSRHQHALHQRLREAVREWIASRDATFAKSIPLKDPAELTTFLSLNACVLRGLATSMEAASDPGLTERVMALWSEIASAHLTRRAAPASPEAPPPTGSSCASS